MSKIIFGQASLILCCCFYLIWWYRGYRPGVTVNRVGGINGILLFITAALGVTGTIMSLRPVEMVREPMLPPHAALIGWVVLYITLLFITRVMFKRIVTTELVLITAWTMLEITVADTMYAAGGLGREGFLGGCAVIAAAFLISMILYVAYYRMDENKAFYAAMVPLVTEAASMAAIVAMAV